MGTNNFGTFYRMNVKLQQAITELNKKLVQSIGVLNIYDSYDKQIRAIWNVLGVV